MYSIFIVIVLYLIVPVLGLVWFFRYRTAKTLSINSRKIFFLSFYMLLLPCYGQSVPETQIMKNIDAMLKNTKVSKIEKKGKILNGNYKNITIYVVKNIPILIEIHETKIVNFFYSDHTSSREEKINAKFYIKNWKQNLYIRTGEINYIDINYGTQETTRTSEQMNAMYHYNFDKQEIEHIILKK